MYTYRDYFYLCDKAFNNNVIPLFNGNHNYCINHPYNNIPTDWDKIIDILYHYYLTRGSNEKIVNICYQSILDMLKGSEIDVWCALNVIYTFANSEFNKSAAYTIIDKYLISQLEAALNKNKNKLKYNFNYIGINYPNGLWDDTLIICKLLKAKHIDLNLY